MNGGATRGKFRVKWDGGLQTWFLAEQPLYSGVLPLYAFSEHLPTLLNTVRWHFGKQPVPLTTFASTAGVWMATHETHPTEQ